VNTILRDPSAKAPAPAASLPVVVRRPANKPVAPPAIGAAPGHFAVCAECAYAELYAEEPRARCDCAARGLGLARLCLALSGGALDQVSRFRRAP
jgi:hypothetical protein